MKVLKDAGSFVILTPQAELKNQLLRIERAGRTCYQSEKKRITFKTAEAFAVMLLKSGHESVLEHSYMTVQFDNVCRGFTHEQVRHRLTGISQESTRYVDYAKEGAGVDLEKFQIKCVVPPHRDENEKVDLGDGRQLSLTGMFSEVEMFYRALRKAGWLPQDARQILPIGLKSQIVISANFREWRHVFEMRTTKPAHWEIRRVMCNLCETVQKIVPIIFDDFVLGGNDSNGLRYFIKDPDYFKK